jgi:hypothetical protein
VAERIGVAAAAPSLAVCPSPGSELEGQTSGCISGHGEGGKFVLNQFPFRVGPKRTKTKCNFIVDLVSKRAAPNHPEWAPERPVPRKPNGALGGHGQRIGLVDSGYRLEGVSKVFSDMRAWLSWRPVGPRDYFCGWDFTTGDRTERWFSEFYAVGPVTWRRMMSGCRDGQRKWIIYSKSVARMGGSPLLLTCGVRGILVEPAFGHDSVSLFVYDWVPLIACTTATCVWKAELPARYRTKFSSNVQQV